MKKPEPKLTDTELEIMHVVWELGSGTVRQAHELLNQQRPLAYTTVMTMMKKMESRGHLKKRSEGRAFVYTATVPESRMLRRIVGDFIDRVFNGSTEPLLAQLVEERRLSEKDLETISRMILEKKSKN